VKAARGLHVGVVGPLDVQVSGAVVRRGRLDELAGDRLVLVSARSPAAAGLADAAAAHPETHYALVGASVTRNGLANLAGIVLRHDQAARLGGVVAGLMVANEGGRQPRVAWVGPEERALANAFVEGVHDIAPAAVVLREWSADRPAACKESALEAVSRGATVVMAHRGLCAEAAIAGAHQQNTPGLRLSDFELPDVAAAQVARDAVNGIYHGGEDLVFAAASGAIAIRVLDARIPSAIAVQARTAAQQLSSGRLPTG
jgi:basic membrane lipoprotein Med (substrate-binding protein (PBP1-ABC) superfamily)